MQKEIIQGQRAQNFLDILGVVFLFAAVVIALYYWDPTRVYFKRITVADEYLYGAVEPRFLAPDPAEILRVRDEITLSKVRGNAIQVIWGRDGLPAEDGPDEIVRDIDKREDLSPECAAQQFNGLALRLRCEVGNYVDWENLSGIDELRIAVGPAYVASVAFFRPRRANGILVIYQNGYASTYHAQHRYLERLVARGYSVAATNLVNYGDNMCSGEEASRWCRVSAGDFDVPHPLRVYFTPLVKTINHALTDGRIRHVAMVGFSAGAWVSAVMSAVDTRIERSYPVAGVIPFYMRKRKEWPPLTRYQPLMDAAGMLDFFVAGASGPGRRQVQFFNRYDRCCYNGLRSLVYEKAVQAAVRESGGGSFDVVIDETHARHKISRWTFDRILRDLELPWGQ